MANTKKINDLINERVALVKESREFLDSCEGKLTAEDDAKWKAMHDRITELGTGIEDLEAEDRATAERFAKQQAIEEDLERVRSGNGLDSLIKNGGNAPRDIVGHDGAVAMDPLNAVNFAIQGWAVGQKNPMAITDDHRDAMKVSGCRVDSEGGLFIPLNRDPAFKWQRVAGTHGQPILNAQSTSTTSGGDFIPEGFVNNLERALLEFGGMRQVATIQRTDTGNDLPFPTTDDTSNSGALLAENIQDSEQDVTTSAVTLQAYKYTSKIVRVSVELEQDSAFNMGATLGSLLGERLARIQNNHATVGSGTAQPNGIVTASTVGPTAASATAITADELIALKHDVDPAYRRMNASWMFEDATLEAISKLKDGNGQYLWQPGMRGGAPDMLLGHPYTVNQDMPSIASAQKSVIFGALSKYVIREVRGITLVRMVERYADYHQVGYVAFLRFDGDLLDAGVAPVKHLLQAT